MRPELTKLWIAEFEEQKEIRADFSNGRHHAVTIHPPHRIDQVAIALIDIAENIMKDPHLVPGAPTSPGTP